MNLEEEYILEILTRIEIDFPITNKMCQISSSQWLHIDHCRSLIEKRIEDHIQSIYLLDIEQTGYIVGIYLKV
jgi:hypothetical protein